MLTVLLLLIIAAFVITIAAAMQRAPLYVAVLILCVIELMRTLPLGR